MARPTIVEEQIFFLRLLTKYDSDILTYPIRKSRWIPLFDVIKDEPKKPIFARSILKKELVLEIDNDNWNIVRDGTRRIISILKRWGADDCYYLSFSGNRSIHVHVFFSTKEIELEDDTTDILKGADSYEIGKEVKSYLMRQFQYATDTVLDMSLAGKHLIRMEGSINEKSRKYCSMIDSVPDEKPVNYGIMIPDSLPAKQWDMNIMKDELNDFLKIHFKKSENPIHYGPGKPVQNPDSLLEILKPIYLPGYRHYIVLALSGYLKRHNIPLDLATKIVKGIAGRDEELSTRLYSLKEVYRADKSKKIAGLPKLIEIIRREATEGKISTELRDSVISKLNDFQNMNVKSKTKNKSLPAKETAA